MSYSDFYPLPSQPLLSHCLSSPAPSILSWDTPGVCLGPGSCTSHSSAQHRVDCHSPVLSLQGSRGWGAPETLPSSCSQPGLKRKSIHGKSQAGICNPAMVPCSGLTCNPRPTETATACLPEQLYCTSAPRDDGDRAHSIPNNSAGLTSLIQLLQAT